MKKLLTFIAALLCAANISAQDNWVELLASGDLEGGRVEFNAANFTFHNYDGWGADATETGTMPGGFLLNESNGCPIGDSSCNAWVDLTDYSKLYVKMAGCDGDGNLNGSNPRIFINRTADNGQFNADKDASQCIVLPNGGWAAEYYTQEEDGTYVIDLKKIADEWGFVHFHSIKGSAWNTQAIVYSIEVEKEIDLKNFAVKENNVGPMAPTITEGVGKDGTNGIKVTSPAGAAQDWDTQFWIVFDEVLPEGTKIKVEFDYKASTNVGEIDAQAHHNPGEYLTWYSIAKPNFTTVWQHYSNEVTVDNEMTIGQSGAGEGFKSIAFNLSKDKANDVEFFFDNFSVKKEDAPIVEPDMVNIVNNDCFFSKESNGEILPSTIDEEGVIAVTSLAGASQDWDTQFWIRTPGIIPQGASIKVTFDYKASINASADTQIHNEPGQYVHWSAIGSPNFTTEWQSYKRTLTIPSECNGNKHSDTDNWLNLFHSIAFNLSKDRENDVTFYFKNIKVEVLEEDLTAGMLGMPFESGKYYIGNVSAADEGKPAWWGAGNDWGTQASLLKNPDYVTLHFQTDGTYLMESQVSNGGTSYYFNGAWMDQTPPLKLKIKRGELMGYADDDETIPVYTYYIYDANPNADGLGFFGWDGSSTVLASKLAADNPNAAWMIATEEELIKGLNEASVREPGDATFLIIDHTFGRNNRNVGAWNVSADCNNSNLTGGNSNKHSAESYHSTFTIWQDLTNVPNGVYSFTAQGFYRQDGSDNENLAEFFVNEETALVPLKTGTENNMADACTSFEAGKYKIEPIFFEVTDGLITVGVRNPNNTNLWVIWDNFELTYYGADCTIEDAKNAAIFDELEELMDEAAELMNQTTNVDLIMELGAAYSLATNAETVEEAKAAIEALKAAIMKANAYIYAGNVLPKMKEFTESTNFYTMEALEEYYTKWQIKYDAGTLTTDEANALQDPSITTDWRADNKVDDLLMSVWDAEPMNWDTYHVNTWSTEGNNDGTNFVVPFIEYWTGDGDRLAEKALTATITDLPNDEYFVSAWVRVRLQNGATDPYGITAQVNDGEEVNVTDGEPIVTNNGTFALKEINAAGNVTDGVLKFKFNVAADNNISWLSFKNVKYVSKTTVGIDEVKANTADNTVYNLGGQKVKNAQKGIYIVGGKKIVK